MPHVESVCAGLWLAVGSRHERATLSGISHFVEHLLFKGTRKRTARQISREIEGVGGYLDGFTGEEMTCCYAAAGAKHAELLLDVLFDMVDNPTFPADEIEKERGVILEEIKMYEDQPAQRAQELLNSLLWPDHPLGRPITGFPETVAQIGRKDLVAHWKKYYAQGRLYVVVAGNIDPGKVVDFVLKRASSRRKPVRRSYPVFRDRRSKPGVACLTKPVEQTHLAIGLRGVSRHDPRRLAVKLASVILGENMSSRLFQILREEHGLAYSISSGTCHFADTGALTILAGVETDRALEALQLILRVVASLGRKLPSSAELRRAKEYVIGQLYLGLESTINQMLWVGESLVGYGSVWTPAEYEKAIEAVGPEAVQNVCRYLASDRRLCVAVVGPEPPVEPIQAVASFRP